MHEKCNRVLKAVFYFTAPVSELNRFYSALGPDSVKLNSAPQHWFKVDLVPWDRADVEKVNKFILFFLSINFMLF